MQDRAPLRLVASEPPARPQVPPLDLTPTGRLPHTAANARQANTTMKTALAALDAAAQLRQATARLAGLYGTEVMFSVDRNRVRVMVSPRGGHPTDRIEALAGDIAILTGAELHPDVDPVDLSITLTGSGVHDTTGVWITVPVPYCDQADGDDQ